MGQTGPRSHRGQMQQPRSPWSSPQSLIHQDSEGSKSRWYLFVCVCVSQVRLFMHEGSGTAASQHDVPRSHNTARLTSHLVNDDHEKVQDWRLSRLYFFYQHS